MEKELKQQENQENKEETASTPKKRKASTGGTQQAKKGKKDSKKKTEQQTDGDRHDFEADYDENLLSYKFDSAEEVPFVGMPDRAGYKKHIQLIPVSKDPVDAVELFQFLVERGYVSKIILPGNRSEPGFISDFYDAASIPINSIFDFDCKKFIGDKADLQDEARKAIESKILRDYADQRDIKGSASKMTEQEVIALVPKSEVSIVNWSLCR